MKESYREGVASHSGPEPCEGGGNVALEALDTGICRLGIELRNRQFGEPTASDSQEGYIAAHVSASARRPGGVEDPRHAEKLHAREPGGPATSPSTVRQRAGRGTHKGKPFMRGGRESSGCIVPTNGPNKCRQLQAEGREGRRLAEEIRRQGPELDPAPAAPGAIYCLRNAPAKLVGDVIIQGGNRVR